ncbi:hypothetical protein D3C76_1278510 [compost metagenome]
MSFIGEKASRVDLEESLNEMNTLRISLFKLLTQALQHYLGIEGNDELLLMYTRIYFYNLHGIVTTYVLSDESLENLLERLLPTFEQSIEVLLIGLQTKFQGRNGN